MKRIKVLTVMLFAVVFCATLVSCGSKANTNSETAAEQTELLVDLSKIVGPESDYEEYFNENFQYLKEAIDTEYQFWYKGCQWKSEKITTTQGPFQEEVEFTDYYPIETNEKSVWISVGANRAEPLSAYIIVWGSENFDKMREQLKQLGYQETEDEQEWYYKKNGDETNSARITKENDEYTLRIELDEM